MSHEVDPRWFAVGNVEGRAPRAWPRFMTARVAADYSDTSPWTIRRHVRPCGRRGRTFVYSIESVEEWMRGQAPGLLRDDAPISKPRSTRSNLRRDRELAKADRAEPIVNERENDVAA